MATRKKATSEEEQIRKSLETARRLLDEKGHASSAKLGAPKIRAAVAAKLVEEGFEATSKGVRVPLFEQGLKLVALGHPVPLTTLGKRLGGASQKEAKDLAKALTARGEATLVLRDKQQVLVPPSERALSRDRLRSGLAELSTLLGWVKKAASDKLGTSVLDADLLQALGEVRTAFGFSSARTTPQAPTPNPAAPAQAMIGSGRDLSADVRGAVLSLRDEDTALARVPELSRQLRPQANATEVKDALLAACRRGELELRPEGGIGRLTSDDAALCPVGAGGVPLSWVRLTEGQRVNDD